MNDGHPEAPMILFAPNALDRLASGIDHLAALLAVTLGPGQGNVLNMREGGSVEVLADAGPIARRVVEIPGRGRNTGAMILRHLVWQMHEQCGDGAATAAVLARAMVREAIRRIAAGVDPVVIRGGLERALTVALSSLATLAEPPAGQDTLAAVATGITGEPDLGAVLGEMVEVLGPAAALTIEEFPVPFLDREYVEGAYWRAHPATRAMIPEGQQRVVLEHPLILLADQELAGVDDVRLALELAACPADRRPLLVVPAKIGDRALSTITVNQAQGTVAAIVARLGTVGPAHSDDLADMAVITGGAVLAGIVGRPPSRVQLAELGTARRAIISRNSLIIIGGAGHPELVAQRTADLQAQAARLTGQQADRQRLEERIARLSGGIGVLKLGARFGSDLKHRRAQAEKAFRVLTGMLTDGVVPGGGVGFVDCLPAVRAARDTCPGPGEEHGFDVLLTALEAPFKQIVSNHGIIHPPVALAAAIRLGPGHGLDVISGGYVDMRQHGIVDSLRVTTGALRLATSAAASVMTTGVVVLPVEAKRERRMRP